MDLLNCMKSFQAVVDNGSFSVAARHLFVSPSKLSKQITWLESHLKTQLIIRSTRQLQLTEAGQLFYDQATEVLDKVREAKEVSTSASKTPHGLIRLQAPVLFGQHHVTPIVVKFLKKYPDVKFDFLLSNQYIDPIEKRIDVVISMEKNLYPNFKSRELFSVKRGIFGAPRYFEKHGTPKTPGELGEHNCLAYDVEYLPGMWVLGRNKKILAKGRLRCNDRISLIQAAVSGLGLIHISTEAILTELEKGHLKPVLVDYMTAESQFYVLYRNKGQSKLETFVDFLTKEIQK